MPENEKGVWVAPRRPYTLFVFWQEVNYIFFSRAGILAMPWPWWTLW